MGIEIDIGDVVRLLSIPQWLIRDLPEDEQRDMIAFVGSTAVVTEIDDHGYYWIGFGKTIEITDSAHYSGHSFCVPRECLQLHGIEDSPPPPN